MTQITPEKRRQLWEREKRHNRLEREKLRVQKRKAVREAKAKPRRELAAWSRAALDEGVCSICGVGVVTKLDKDGNPKLNKRGKPIKIYLHAHHILPYQYWKAFRTEPMNRLCLCPACHKYGPKSAHQNPVYFALWLRDNRPEQFAWVATVLGFDPSGPRR